MKAVWLALLLLAGPARAGWLLVPRAIRGRAAARPAAATATAPPREIGAPAMTPARVETHGAAAIPAPPLAAAADQRREEEPAALAPGRRRVSAGEALRRLKAGSEAEWDGLEEEVVPVAIVGAGPAGLSMAVELRRRGIEPLILEKGTVGNTFREIPGFVQLLNHPEDTRLDHAPDLAPAADPRTGRVPIRGFAGHLGRYARRFGFALAEGVEVLRDAPEPDGTRLVTVRSGGAVRGIRALHTVGATGMWSNPASPEDQDKRPEAARMHYVEYGDDPANLLARLEAARAALAAEGRAPTLDVLVVGAGLSAGDVVENLGRRGGLSIGLVSRRGAPKGLHGGVLRRLEELAMMLANRLGFQGRPGRTAPSPMRAEALKAVREHASLYGEIAAYDGYDVVFKDGRRETVGVVLNATGYRPAAGYVADLRLGEDGYPLLDPRTLTAEGAPNHTQLGRDGSRTARSGFINGMREDARAAAAAVAARLR